MEKIASPVMVIRGGGDLATGVIQKFYHAGFRVAVLETAQPLAIRRTAALCSAVYKNTFQVEDMIAQLAGSEEDCERIWQQQQIPVLIDPEAHSLNYLKPQVVIDSILAKRNLGTHREMAPITIALGPGFTAPNDVDIVVETMRGHSLGRVYMKGSALPNTGIPGELGGKTAERVIHSPDDGIVRHLKKIGDVVEQGEPLFYVGERLVCSPLKGTLRGLIYNGLTISKGLKCADVDPRPSDQVDCFTISDKARALGGAALDAALMLGQFKHIFSCKCN